ncbi:MAG: phosphate transport system protein [Actinomycetota bacterium]|nr:phosphate transport system protein [Actinomycetota bacterium]
MVETRWHFHEQLAELESIIMRMGLAAHELFSRALEVVVSGNEADADEVIAGDDEIDAFYMEIERGIVVVFATQGPVASDLRFLATLLHINLHLERIADMGVNIAKIVKAAHGLPPNPRVLATLQEMGGIALGMLTVAMDAFARRDVSLARSLPAMDDPLDDLNRGMLAEILMESDGRPMLEWGVHMHVVSRQIERVGDHAVDIGEQVAYLVTGVFQEFTDASHPEVEASARLGDTNGLGGNGLGTEGGEG